MYINDLIEFETLHLAKFVRDAMGTSKIEKMLTFLDADKPKPSTFEEWLALDAPQLTET